MRSSDGGARAGSTFADMRQKARAGKLKGKEPSGSGAIRKDLSMGSSDIRQSVEKGALPGPWANRRDPHIPRSLVRT